MNNQIVSIREMQRNYRRLINRVKQAKQPLYLGARSKKEAVLLDVDSFERLKIQADWGGERWGEVKETLNWIRKGQKRSTNLADFIYADRKTR